MPSEERTRIVRKLVRGKDRAGVRPSPGGLPDDDPRGLPLPTTKDFQKTRKPSSMWFRTPKIASKRWRF